MKLASKNIIITGASSGIGYLLVDKIRQYNNTKIVCAARNIASIPSEWENVSPIALDLSNEAGVDELFSYANEIFNNRIDVFIANAGLAYIESLGEADWGHIDYIYALNVFSPIYSLQKLVQNSNGNHKQQFACTISGAGLVSLPYYSLYCSSKAALHHFIESYRYENTRQLSITAIYPVATKTSFFDKASQSRGFPLPFPQQSANSVAEKIIRGIGKDRKRIYPSIVFRWFYPITRVFPFLLKIYALAERRKLDAFFGKA